MGFLEAIIVITGFVLWFICGYQVGKLNNKINNLKEKKDEKSN